MPTLKLDLPAHLDHPEETDNQAALANLDNPADPDKLSNLVEDKDHLDLLAHLVNPVDLDNLDNLLHLNLVHQAQLVTKDHPAHLVLLEIQEALATMAHLVVVVLAITAHLLVLLQAIKDNRL